MTTREIQAFEKTLRAERERALGAASRCRGNIAIEQSAETIEQIGYVREREMALLDIDRQSRRLGEIQAALARIREGSFGICQQCETPIPHKRLAAVPWTALCVRCQESADRAGERASDPYGSRSRAA